MQSSGPSKAYLGHLFVVVLVCLYTGCTSVEAQSRFRREGKNWKSKSTWQTATLEDLSDFSALVSESEQMQKDWHNVFVAALSGRNGVMSTLQDAEEPIKNIVHTVETGGDLSRLVALDNSGDPVQFY